MAAIPQPIGPMATSRPFSAPATQGMAVLASQPNAVPKPPTLMPSVVMANLANSSGERMLANVMVTAPPTVARAIMPAATLAMVPASSGLASIHALTLRVTLVMFWIKSRMGPLLVSVILMPTSSQALRRPFRSPPMLSARTLATWAASPMELDSTSTNASMPAVPCWAISSAMPAPGSSPKMAFRKPARSALPIVSVARATSARIRGTSLRLP